MKNDTETKIRLYIDVYSPDDLAHFTDISLDFIREFKDKIDIPKLFEIFQRNKRRLGLNWYFSNEGRKTAQLMKKIQKEFMRDYYEI